MQEGSAQLHAYTEVKRILTSPLVHSSELLYCLHVLRLAQRVGEIKGPKQVNFSPDLKFFKINRICLKMAAVMVTESELAGSFQRIGEDASDRDLLAKCTYGHTIDSREV